MSVTTSPYFFFEFVSDRTGSTFECLLDRGAFEPCTAPWTYVGLAPGPHGFAVRAMRGRTGPAASFRWAVAFDPARPPETTITRHPDDPSTVTDATFSFHAEPEGAPFECRLDDAPFEPCSSPKQYNRLGEGRHTFRVRAVGAGGRRGPPASHT